MKRIIRGITRVVYGAIVKPILFHSHPDDVHRRLVQRAVAIQRMPGIRALPKLWRHNSPKLTQTIHGVQYKNPVGLSAGFDKNIEIAPMVESVGFGFIMGGSVTAQPCDGNPHPWFHRLPEHKSLLVYAGLPNDGATTIAARLQCMRTSFPLGISVAKTNSCDTVGTKKGIVDYLAGLKAFAKTDVHSMYELNISCPNTHGGEPFTTPDTLEALLAKTDALKLQKPLFIKMPIDKPWKEFSQLLEVVATHNVQGVSIGNLRKQRVGLENIPDDAQGNLSGKPCQKISTELIRNTYKKYGDKLTIIGIGGIFCAEDAYEKIRAGASLVALITGMIYEGPQLIGEINDGLERLLTRDGYAHITDAIGVDADKNVKK